MTDPKGAILSIASQAREAEVVREAVEEHREEVSRRVLAHWRRQVREDIRPRSDAALDALACLVALCAGQQWPPKEEK